MWIFWKFPCLYSQCSPSRWSGRGEACKRWEWGWVTKALCCIKTGAAQGTKQTQHPEYRSQQGGPLLKRPFSVFESLSLFFHHEILHFSAACSFRDNPAGWMEPSHQVGFCRFSRRHHQKHDWHWFGRSKWQMVLFCLDAVKVTSLFQL